jgi:hypothetical protein
VDDLRDGTIMLLYCDRVWDVRAFSVHDTVMKAKRRAERVYPGSRSHWKPRKVSLANAKSYITASWKGHECSFCGKTPEEIDAPIIEGKAARICGPCIENAHSILARDDGGNGDAG